MKNYRKVLDILLVLAILANGVGMIKLGDRLIAFQNGEMTNALDIEQLRQDLNRVGNSTDAVTGWLPNGGENPSFHSIDSDLITVDIPPISGSTYGHLTSGTPQALSSGSFNAVTEYEAWSEQGPDSIVVWYDQPSGKFHINPVFSLRDIGFISVFGNYLFDADEDILLVVAFYNKANDANLGNTLLQDGVQVGGSFSGVIPFEQLITQWEISASNVYFKIEIYPSSAANLVGFRIGFLRIR